MSEHSGREPLTQDYRRQIEALNGLQRVEETNSFFTRKFTPQVRILRDLLNDLEAEQDAHFRELNPIPHWCGILLYNLMREVLIRKEIEPEIVAYESFWGNPGPDGWTAEQAAQFLDLLQTHPDPAKKALYQQLIA